MYYLDMYFPTNNDIPDFGTIRMTNVGCKILGTNMTDNYEHKIDVRIRNYILMSCDSSKLDLINNAADGSKAVAADTGEEFVLCDGLWNRLPKPPISLPIKWHQIESAEE